MLPPIPDFIVFFGLVILGFIANIRAFYYQKKARKYKRELDLLKRQFHSDELDSNLAKPQTSTMTNAITKITSIGDDT